MPPPDFTKHCPIFAQRINPSSAAACRSFAKTLFFIHLFTMKHFFLLLFASLLLCRAEAQSYRWEKSKSGPYPYQFVANDPIKARYYTLKNGLTVILSVNKEMPRIQTIIATKAGSKTDPKDHTGLAHYLEHMLFKGTDKYGSLDWSKEKPILDLIDALYENYNMTTGDEARKTVYHAIDSASGAAAKFAIANEYDKMMAMIGAQGTNAFTSFEETAYVNDIPTNQIDRWLTIEAERFRNPVLRIFHTELEAVYEEKNRSLDADDDKVFELLFDRLFQKHNYGQQTTIGTIEHLKNPSLKAIREYFYKNYVPNNMCIVMAGDLNPDQVIAKIDNAFGYMQPKPVPEYTFEPEAPILSPIEGHVFGPDAEYVTMGFRFPGADSKDALMLNFMSNILSNGNAGLLDLNLVKKQQVLSASAGAYSLKDYSILFMEGKAKEGQKLEEVKQLMLDQIGKLQRGEFDEQMLTAIINNYKRDRIRNQESNYGRAYSILDAFVSGRPWDKVVGEIDVMSKLTKRDIQEFANKWLLNNYVCIYKHTGKDPNTKKVDKPAITPVEVNREAQSPFLKKVASMTAPAIKPVFVNFDKDIIHSTVNTANGSVPLLAVQNKTNTLFSQYDYIEAGSLHNPLFPLAMDYLQYLGTDKFSAEEISKQFYSLACDFGVSVGTDESYVYLNGLQENFEQGVMLFEHLLKNCRADNEALAKMIAGMKKKRSDAKLNKNIIRSGLMNYARYGMRNPFNHQLTNEELDQVKAEDLIGILHNFTSFPHSILYYGPANVGVLSGQLAKLHPLPSKFQDIPGAEPFTFTTQTANSVLFTDYDMVQAEIQWCRNNDRFDVNQVPVINLFNEYFGGNMSGIVFQEIRESRALAYSTYAYYGIPRKKSDPFSITAYVGCQADKMREAVAGMQQLLTELPKSQKLFNNSKVSIKNSISTNRTTKTDILFTYLDAKRKGLTYDLDEKIYKATDALTFDDINNFHKKKIAGLPYVMTVVGSEAKVNWDVLKGFGDVKKITLRDIFGY